MTRINVVRSNAENRFLTWGKNSSTLVFAAVLIICSVTIGCSSDKPKPVTADNQISMTQPQSQPQAVPAPTVQPESTPIPKKRVVHRRPATVNYSDKSSGVTFEYPRRYAIETGNAASELLQTSAIPMNFVQPGGLALAAVELPETGFQNTDFSSAFFNVSVNKALTADQCTEFAVPQPKVIVQSESAPAATLPSNAVTSSEVAKQDSAPATAETKSDPQPVASQIASRRFGPAEHCQPIHRFRFELEAAARRYGTSRHRSCLRRRHPSERLQVFPCLPEWSLLRVCPECHDRRFG